MEEYSQYGLKSTRIRSEYNISENYKNMYKRFQEVPKDKKKDTYE